MACILGFPYPISPPSPKPGKPLTLTNYSNFKSSILCHNASRSASLSVHSSEDLSSLSSPPPAITPNPQIFSNAVAGASLMSSLLVALILILKLGRKRQFTQRSIVRHSNESVELGNRPFLRRSVSSHHFESKDACVDLDLKFAIPPSIRASCGYPQLNSSFLGSVKSFSAYPSVSNVPSLGNGMNPVPFDSSTRRFLLCGVESVRNSRKVEGEVVVNFSAEPIGFLDEQVQRFSETNASSSSRKQVFLPITSVAHLGIPASSVVSVTVMRQYNESNAGNSSRNKLFLPIISVQHFNESNASNFIRNQLFLPISMQQFNETNACNSNRNKLFLPISSAGNSNCSQLFLPVNPVVCSEILASSLISVEEKEKLSYKTEFQSAIPLIVVWAGAFGLLTTGVDGGLELIGFIAATSFFLYDILWASKRSCYGKTSYKSLIVKNLCAS
uniref:Uncharacterized protein n=1 Tax=Nelumbo nucifera TaxID=4432 RepID=A0A822XN08_NELNU|nr:TPA_asm: hypothetical protein HUJ06_022044 [Nelumbo nucifera]